MTRRNCRVAAQAAVQAAFEARRNQLFGPKGELARILEAALPELEGSLGEGRSLALLEVMRMGEASRTMEDHLSATNESQASSRRSGSTPLCGVCCSAPDLHLPGRRAAGEYTIRRDCWGVAGAPAGSTASPERRPGGGNTERVLPPIALASIDERWVEYLTHQEELRYEVRLGGMAHNDPLVVYKSKSSSALLGVAGRTASSRRSPDVPLPVRCQSGRNLRSQLAGEGNAKADILEVGIKP